MVVEWRKECCSGTLGTESYRNILPVIEYNTRGNREAMLRENEVRPQGKSRDSKAFGT